MGNVFFKEETYEDFTDSDKKELKLHRGDILMVDLGWEALKGSEQRGYRPAIVIQNNVGNKYSPTIIVALITSKDKQELPTHMDLDLYEPSLIMTEQIQTVDKTRVNKKIGRLKSEYFDMLDHKISVSLGLVHKFAYKGDLHLQNSAVFQ